MVVPRDPAVVSVAMKRVKGKDTSPELRLRRLLWRRGLRYRVHADLVGRPDIVFPGPRVAVFVDGDFWHGRQWRSRGFASVEAQLSHVHNGTSYWLPKIKRTIDRDIRVTNELVQAGWDVIRVWESDLKSDPEGAAGEVEAAVRRRTT